MRLILKEMKRFYILIATFATLLCGCINSNMGGAQINDLTVGGLTDRNLMLDGTAGVSTTFTIRANYDWKIIDYKGFTCDPSSGTKTAMGEMVTVTATPLQSNNSADTIRLSDLNFKLLSTRFVGISAYQLPQIRFPKGNKATLGPMAGSSTTVTFSTNAEDVEITTSGEISATVNEDSNKKEYTVTITTSQDNTTTEDIEIGSVGFIVGSVKQGAKITVNQAPAIVLDRSSILLPSKAGVSNMFEIESDFDVEIRANSSEFIVTKSSYSDKIYTVTSTLDNTTDAELELGTIDVSLVGTPECMATIAVRQRKAKAPQTIIAHFIGTALAYYFSNNIDAMLNALSADIQGDAQVLALMTESTNDATLYELRYDGELGKAVKEKVCEVDLPTPYDGALFESNLRKALAFAPAEKYAMIIGSHGLAWIPKNSAITPSSLLRHGFEPSQFWVREEGTEMTRHIGDKAPTRYNIEEVADAIAANNIKLDYILFDACFMSNIESAYILRNATSTIIASPCEVMGSGFPYAKIMKYMLTNEGTDYDIDKICSGFVEHYRTEATTKSACVAAINTAELENLAVCTKAVNASIRANLQSRISENITTFEDVAQKIDAHITALNQAGAETYQLKNLCDSFLKSISNIKEMIADEGNDECTMGYSVVRYYNVLISTLDQIRNKIVALPIVDSTDIVSAIDNRISHLTSEITNVRFISSVQYYEGQDPHSFYDMGDLYRLSQANGDVVSAFKQQLDKTVTSRYHTTQFYSAYGSGNHYHDITYYTGISTSSMVEHYAIDWVKTSWYEATH